MAAVTHREIASNRPVGAVGIGMGRRMSHSLIRL